MFIKTLKKTPKRADSRCQPPLAELYTPLTLPLSRNFDGTYTNKKAPPNIWFFFFASKEIYCSAHHSIDPFDIYSLIFVCSCKQQRWSRMKFFSEEFWRQELSPYTPFPILPARIPPSPWPPLPSLPPSKLGTCESAPLVALNLTELK